MSNNPYSFPPPPRPGESYGGDSDQSNDFDSPERPFASPFSSNDTQENIGAGYGMPQQESQQGGYSASSPYAAPQHGTHAPSAAMPYYQHPYAQQAAPSSGLAVAALVLGIVSLLFAWLPVFNIFTGVAAVVGLVLGIVGILKANKGTASGKGMAIAGVSISALAILMGTIINILVFSAAGY